MKQLTIISLMWLFLGTSVLLASDEMVGPNNGDTNDFSMYSNQVILDWNLVALEAMGGETYMLPLVNSRINAMMHIAMHDAINSIAPKYESYAFKGINLNADPIAAAASAAHAVLEVHFADQKAMLDEHLNKSLSTFKNKKKKKAGIELGKAAAASILKLRENDDAFQDPIGTVPPSTIPGVYQLVPPFDFVYGEFWKTMKPIRKDSIEKIKTLEIETGSSLEFSKDIFLFSYYCRGLNFVDLAQIKWHNIHDGRLMYRRSKTSASFNIKLLAPALDILNKYRDVKDDSGYIFPIYNSYHDTAQKQYNRRKKVLGYVNADLRTIGERIGIPLKITSYVARHTYATVLKTSGVSTSIVKESLGYSRIQTTEIYLDSFGSEELDKANEGIL